MRDNTTINPGVMYKCWKCTYQDRSLWSQNGRDGLFGVITWSETESVGLCQRKNDEGF